MSAPRLAGQLGEMRITLQITRAATGKTETVEVIGRVMADDEPMTENDNGSDSQHDG